jgi:hypothetical protein
LLLLHDVVGKAVGREGRRVVRFLMSSDKLVIR